MEVFRGRIGVVGAGALGGFYGARLARAGHDVHFLMRRDYEFVREHGLRVLSIEGDFEVHPPVYPSAAELGVCDLILIGLKTTDNQYLPDLFGPTVGPTTLVLTLQNGLGNEAAIARALVQCGAPAPAADRILGGTAFLCSNRIAPGVIRHSDHGWVCLAEFVGPARERTHTVARVFRDADIDCEVVDSLARLRWEKLVWNVPFNGLSVAAAQADTAAILGDETLRRAARSLMDEVIAAARADEVAIDPALADRMMQATESMGAYRNSMQLDYAAGRPLEVEAILGEPVRRARAAGIAVPGLELLCGVVRRLDALNR